MSAMPAITVPDNIKRNVRAVLLSKVGGVLVSDLVKDYKSLLKEPLKFKDLGFSSIKEFVEAMPEVCRLEYDEGIMAHKLYGVGDKSTYMSLSQKRAEKSKQSVVSNGKKDTKGSRREENPELQPNSKGLYTLCYPRAKEPKSFDEQDLQEKFSEFGNLAQINKIPGLFFLRFSTADSAQAALDRYADELELRPAEEKMKQKQNFQNENKGRRKSSEEVTTGGNDFSSTSAEGIEVFVGNIPYECDKDAFKAEINSSSHPSEIRIKTAKGCEKKIYAFVKFNQKSQAEDFISKYSGQTYHGRQLIVRYSNPGPPPNYKQGGAGREGKSAKSRSQMEQQPEPAFEEEEEKWDEEPQSDGSSSVWGKIPREPVTSPEPPHVTDIMSDQIQEQSPPVSAMEELHINTDFHLDTNFRITDERNSPPVSLHSHRSREGPRQTYSPATSIHNQRSRGGEPRGSVLRGTNPQPTPKAKRPQPGRYPYSEDSLDDMPSLEPAGSEFGPPPLQRIDQGPQIFISNFPYGESDEELIDYFSQYGCFDVVMINRNDPKVSTRAMLYVANMEEAYRAVMECNQMTYKGRRLLVNISKHIGDTTVNFLSSYHSMDNIKCTVTSNEGRKTTVETSSETGPGGDGLRRAESITSISSQASPQGEPTVKSWNALIQTYKIIMNTLHIKPYMKRPQTKDIVIYVTSVFDQKNFWGQIVVDEGSLNELSDVMTGLQNKENRIGPTKGLGRCAALYNKEWYRAWIVGEKSDYRKVNVFFVDYGNTDTLDRRMTSLTTPYIWETKPILQPFTMTSEAPGFEIHENMILSAQVSRFGVDESGYVTEVTIQDILQ